MRRVETRRARRSTSPPLSSVQPQSDVFGPKPRLAAPRVLSVGGGVAAGVSPWHGQVGAPA